MKLKRIYSSTKNHKIIRYKYNRRGPRPIHCKIPNTAAKKKTQNQNTKAAKMNGEIELHSWIGRHSIIKMEIST